MDKRESELRHATRRGKERYKRDFSRNDLERMSSIIQEGNSTFIKKESNTRKVHEIEFDGKPMRVVYDKLRKCIVTFLHVRKH